MWQVITHNTGETEIIENYNKPTQKTIASFNFVKKNRKVYQDLIHKIYRVKNKHELYVMLTKNKNITKLKH